MTKEHSVFVSMYDLVYELAYTGEEERRTPIFDFFKCCFLNFYKAELNSEDRFVLRRVRAFRRYLFC